MLKNLLLVLCLLIFVSIFSNAQECTPPTNQPTSLTFSGNVQTSITGSFTAAENIGTVEVAEAYLVLVSTSETLTHAPSNGTLYAANNLIGNAKVVSFGTSTNFTASGLTPNTKYYFFIYSAKAGGTCYNTNAPLKAEKSTLADPGTVDPGNNGTSNNGTVTNGDQGNSSKLSALLNFNFVGNDNKWSNLTPIIFYGWSLSGRASANIKTKSGEKKNMKLWGNTFQLGPYVGSTISIKDETSFLPAIMLPGNAGLEMNYFMTLGKIDKFSVEVSPLNLGIKVISGFEDASLAVVQHNIRHSIGFRLADYFSSSVQYTTGWHNNTTHSKENFSKIFTISNTKVAYWTVGLTTRLSEDLFGGGNNTSPLYLHLNWRNMAKPSNNFDLPNSRFITVGLITSLNLKSGANPGLMPKAPGLF